MAAHNSETECLDAIHVDCSRAMVKAIPDSMFLLDSNFICIESHSSRSRQVMTCPDDLRGRNICDWLPSQLAERFVRSFQTASDTGELQVIEYEISFDDQARYCEARVTATTDGNFLVVVRDITEWKRMEATLREREEELRRSNAQIRALAGRLMAAHEQERHHIARELHDGINQKVAALLIGVNCVKSEHSAGRVVASRHLDIVQKCALEIAEGIRQLSRRLHPAVLDHVGLAAAVRAYVAEFSALSRIQVDLTVLDEVNSIPAAVAICLYRVIQESLINIAKHSGTNRAELTLSVKDRAVHLRVADCGVGFDLELARRTGGLGLASMEERARLLQGSFSISTSPGRGSILVVIIPLNPPSIYSV